MNLNFKTLRKQIENQLRENLDAPLYVEYFGERGDENPFMLQDQKWQFVNAKYPDGSIDLGVYAFAGDVVYSYVSWRKMLGIDKENKPETPILSKINENYDLKHYNTPTGNLGLFKYRDETIEYFQDVINLLVARSDISKLFPEFNLSTIVAFYNKLFISLGVNTLNPFWDALESSGYKKKLNPIKIVNFLYDRGMEYKNSLNESDVSDLDSPIDNTNSLDGELDFTDEDINEPDYDNDAFIQDVVSGGYDVSVSQKHIGHFEEMDDSLTALKTEFNRSNFFPTIWFVSDHGNTWAVDLEGNELKKSNNDLNENSNKLNENFPELNNMTKYQLEKEFNKVTDEIFALRKKYGNFIPDEIGTLQLKQDAIYKLLYGNEPTGFKNVGKGLNEDFERNKLIASEIINQLGGQGKLKAMTGAYNFVAIDYGVSFRIKNAKANYIKIVVNAMDYYDVEIGRVRGANYTIVNKQEDVPVENLKSLIEKTTGMYLSLFEGVLSIKSLVENHVSEEEYENKLQQLKSEGKITLTIGNHGLIFMQIINSSDFMKSYDSYADAYNHYMKSQLNKD